MPPCQPAGFLGSLPSGVLAPGSKSWIQSLFWTLFRDLCFMPGFLVCPCAHVSAQTHVLVFCTLQFAGIHQALCVG